jgi:DNA-binding NarL/FixJ family response regulator
MSVQVIQVVAARSAVVCGVNEIDAVGIREVLRRSQIDAEQRPAQAVIKRLAGVHIDVVFTDASERLLPQIIEAASRCATPVIAFGADSTPDATLAALAAGCRGYVARSASSERWAEAANVTLNGGTYLSPEVIGDLVAAYQGRTEMLSMMIDHHLTEREWEILGYVAEGRTNREIAGTLFISSDTVRTHVSNILGKLGSPNRAAAAAKYQALARAT